MIRTVIVLAGVVGLIGSAEFVGTAREPVHATTRRNGGVPFRVGEKMTYQAKVNFINAGTATMSVEGIEDDSRTPHVSHRVRCPRQAC